MAERSAWIEDLAGAILDGEPIDWASAESAAPASDLELLAQLRQLATLAGLHRLPRHASRGHAVSGYGLAIPDRRPPVVDSKYSIERSLGDGGMGSVYLARHLGLGKLFAIKLIHHSKSCRPDCLARFRVEAHALGHLDHPNIVQVTDYGVDPEVGPYLVMEYIEGVNLREYLTERGALSLDEALPMVTEIAGALDYAHKSGILHRDLKPANVLLSTRGDGRHVTIVDFGIASFADPDQLPELFGRPQAGSAGPALPDSDDGTGTREREDDGSRAPLTRVTAPGRIIGTVGYLAPEIVKGEKAATSADIFAFGVLIHELLVGCRPLEGAGLPSRAGLSLPEELDDALLRPLNTEPQDRPILARDVVAALVDARHCAAVRMWRRRELPRRAAVSVALITLMLLLYGPLSRLPAIESLENMAVDLRLAYQPRRPPDRRIVLISIDDATVAADSTPLPDMADQAGAVLGTVFDAGARTVGIDLLLPERWSLSEPFSKLILNHASNLVLAGYSTAEGTVTGPEAIQGATAVALGPANVEQLYAFVNVSPDSDGVVRTMPLFYRNQRETLVPSFAARVAEVFMTRSLPSSGDSRLWLDYSIEWTKFQRVSWKDVRHLSATRPDAFRGAVVLVGADFVGSGDIHSVRALAASTPRHVSGLVLHALALNTLLEGTLIRTSPRTVVMALLAVTAGLAAMAILSFPRPGGTVGIVATSTILYVAFSFLLFRRRHELSPIVGPVVTMSVLVVCALVVRGRLAPHPVATAIPETLP